MIFKLHTREGTLVVEVSQPDAEVEVLDEQGEVLVKLKSEKEPLRIGVEPGKSGVRVKKDGFEIFAEEFTMTSGGSEAVKARLLPKQQVAANEQRPAASPPSSVRSPGFSRNPGEEPPIGGTTKKEPPKGGTTNSAAGRTEKPAPQPVLVARRVPPPRPEPKQLPPWKISEDFPSPAIAPFSTEEARKHQERWAKFLKQKVFEENSIGMKFALVPPGEFDMGENDCLATPWYPDSEHPRHRVRLTQPFAMGVCEVTVGDFEKFVAETHYRSAAETNGLGGHYVSADDKDKPSARVNWRYAAPDVVAEKTMPVANVAAEDGEAFCQWLSRKEGRVYRLPTEAEWEYACRAGSDSPYGVARTTAHISEYAWAGEYISIADPAKRRLMPHPVGQKKPNSFGLHDMLGNVWEACADCFDTDFYRRSPRIDPCNTAAGDNRVVRGPCWLDELDNITPFARFNRGLHSAIGFRILRELPRIKDLSPPEPPSPILVEPGQPLSPYANVSRPTPIPGLRSWSRSS